MFITFEGIEGAGKSTQIRAAQAFFQARGREALLVREPGGSDWGDRIRALLLTPVEEKLHPLGELFLFSASRTQLVNTRILPALQAGQVVLCDRFTDSTLAYQCYARGLDLAQVRALNLVATCGLVPDLTLVFDLPVEEGLRRVRVRQGAPLDDRFELEAASFHQRVRQGYLAIAEAEPARVKVISAQLPPEEVTQRLMAWMEYGLSNHSRA